MRTKKNLESKSVASSTVTPATVVPPVIVAQPVKELFDENEKKKEDRKRWKENSQKRQAEREEREQIRQLAPSFAPLIKNFLEFSAGRFPKKIPPTETEIAMISDAFNMIIAKYASAVSRFGAEGALVFSLLMFVTPRMQVEKNEKESPVEKKSSYVDRENGNGKDVHGSAVDAKSQANRDSRSVARVS